MLLQKKYISSITKRILNILRSPSYSDIYIPISRRACNCFLHQTTMFHKEKHILYIYTYLHSFISRSKKNRKNKK